jgi:endonuclease YncB( thermonuclease family)
MQFPPAIAAWLGVLLSAFWTPVAGGLAPVASQDALRALVGTTFTAHVASVIDGDTIDVVRPGGTARLRIRLEGIDSPEFGEPFDQTARMRTRVLVFDRDVRVAGRDVDQYGRLVARVTVSHGAALTDLSVALVSDGLACQYRYSTDPALARAEAQARAAGRGFWARGAQTPSCVDRGATVRPGRNGPGTSVPVARSPAGRPPAAARPIAAGFVGNTRSRVFHLSSCPNAGCPNCTRRFASRADAETEGFTPAGDCLR